MVRIYEQNKSAMEPWPEIRKTNWDIVCTTDKRKSSLMQKSLRESDKYAYYKLYQFLIEMMQKKSVGSFATMVNHWMNP